MSSDQNRYLLIRIENTITEIYNRAGDPEWDQSARPTELGGELLNHLSRRIVHDATFPQDPFPSIRAMLGEAVAKTNEELGARYKARMRLLTLIDHAVESAEGFYRLQRPTKEELDRATHTPPPVRPVS